MTVEQIYSLMNTVTEEILGESNVVAEDLSNVVDVGVQVFDATDVDGYVKSLVNHIGKVIFVSRPYAGGVPSLLMSSWEFGSCLEKIQSDLPLSSETEDWQLENGTSYDQQIFYQPSVSAKFFNKKVTFEIDMSFTELQVKQSFSSAEQLNGFLSMLYNSVDKAMTVRIDGLIMRTINYMIAKTVEDDYADMSALGASSGVKAINLLKLYNDKFIAVGDTPLTAANALTTPEFIRFAAYTMALTANRMSRMTTLFNIDGKERFTPKDMLKIVLLNDFAQAADVYLQSDTFHNEFTKLPTADLVPYWQGSGTGYAFADVSKVYVKTDANGSAVTIPGVLGIMFDRDAMAVCNVDRRVNTSFNAKASFFNNFYKFDCQTFVDPAEQAVVFFIADAA